MPRTHAILLRAATAQREHVRCNGMLDRTASRLPSRLDQFVNDTERIDDSHIASHRTDRWFVVKDGDAVAAQTLRFGIEVRYGDREGAARPRGVARRGSRRLALEHVQLEVGTAELQMGLRST